MKTSKRFLSAVVAPLLLVSGLANAFEVKNIEVEGSNKVGYDTINSYLTISKGEALDSQQVSESIQRLYKTGFFKDVSFYKRDDGTLVIKVIERPSITEIKFEGNSLFNSEVLTSALDGLGIKKGRIYNQSQMDQVILDLKRRYQNQGYYAATIDIETETLPRERINLKIKVNEGEAASIGRINLVGNTVYTDKRLKGLLQTVESATFGSGDKYSKPKMQADIETIKSYYLDRGYAEFKIVSSQVSISADKTKVFSTINMSEGTQYKIADVNFVGELIVAEDELRDLLSFKSGDVFSRSEIINSVTAVRERLSEEGYAFATIEPDTRLDREKQEASLALKITPYNRVYINRIQIEGNTRTRDHVIRREMRQLESAPYSLELVRKSKERLQRLGFFQTTDIETKRVAKDKVDLIVKVKEQPTGSISAGIGFSQLNGVSFNLGVSERNFIGSGNRLNLSLATSAARKNADISVTNPYFTEDGVSLGVGLYYSEIDATELKVADFTTDNIGIRTTLGYPLSENDRITYGLRFDSQKLVCAGDFADKFCKDFIDEYGKSTSAVFGSIGWNHNSTNAFYFPTEGHKTSLSLEAVLPGTSDLPYYKLYASENWFLPLSSNFTLQLKGGLSYGDGYGDNSTLPFYENFYSGGIGSVRGYEPNSLGPRFDLAKDGTDRPRGGNFEVSGTAGLIFPVPFIDDSTNARLSAFVDVGNVYNGIDDFETNTLRSSIGLGASWIAPIGPLVFSVARPVSRFDEDEHQFFQFSLGSGFKF